MLESWIAELNHCRDMKGRMWPQSISPVFVTSKHSRPAQISMLFSNSILSQIAQPAQKNSRRSSNTRPPQMMKASRPRDIVRNQLLYNQGGETDVERLPIHNFEIGGFDFCFCLTAISGFPRFAVSCLA